MSKSNRLEIKARFAGLKYEPPTQQLWSTAYDDNGNWLPPRKRLGRTLGWYATHAREKARRLRQMANRCQTESLKDYLSWIGSL